jgi:carboxylate-amine ligase
VHPFAAAVGELNSTRRYAAIAHEYGPIARRQLVFGLHVHVCVRDSARALAVYNALREQLPTLAALASNAPLFGGVDSGLASVRPKLSELLPRQGIPPAFADWDALADAHAWGRRSGRVPEPASWWWELRLHPEWATIEVRVPDAQTKLGEVAAVAAVVHALVGWLAARHDAGDLPEPAPDWRIAENRWSACRYGLDAALADVRSGRTRPAHELLPALLDELAPFARQLGCSAELDSAYALAQRNGADRMRAIAQDGGVYAATAWLAESFAS